ncbi:MAG: PrgI family protein [Lachnospiraceae bacterium]|nr:PrgI family protein [Lachnospiraceae bacterium]
MIAVRIPNEIRSYKEKLLLGLTIRQLAFSALAIAVCVPLYLSGKHFINKELLGWLVMLAAMPCAGFGFVKYNGMPFEVIIYAVIRQMFIFPARRELKFNNCLREWTETTRQEDLIRSGSLSRKAKKKAEGEAMQGAYQALLGMIREDKRTASGVRLYG